MFVNVDLDELEDAVAGAIAALAAIAGDTQQSAETRVRAASAILEFAGTLEGLYGHEDHFDDFEEEEEEEEEEEVLGA